MFFVFGQKMGLPDSFPACLKSAPKIRKVLKQKFLLENAKSLWPWLVLSCILLVICGLDIQNDYSIAKFFGGEYFEIDYLFYAQQFVFVLILVSILLMLLQLLILFLPSSPVYLTSAQQKLLGITATRIGGLVIKTEKLESEDALADTKLEKEKLEPALSKENWWISKVSKLEWLFQLKPYESHQQFSTVEYSEPYLHTSAVASDTLFTSLRNLSDSSPTSAASMVGAKDHSSIVAGNSSMFSTPSHGGDDKVRAYLPGHLSSKSSHSVSRSSPMTLQRTISFSPSLKFPILGPSPFTSITQHSSILKASKVNDGLNLTADTVNEQSFMGSPNYGNVSHCFDALNRSTPVENVLCTSTDLFPSLSSSFLRDTTNISQHSEMQASNWKRCPSANFSSLANSKYQVATGIISTPTSSPERPAQLRRSRNRSSSRALSSVGLHEQPSGVNATATVDVVWADFNMDENKLETYTQNLRSWISKTILKPIVCEIDFINHKFSCQSRPDLLIGQASVTNLNSFVLTQAQGQAFEAFKTLPALLPYLEIAPLHQEYLVQRLHELADGGCLREFRWKSGGCLKDRTWEESLPTDTQLLLHFLCTYLDAQLPPNPLIPNGRTFSQQFLSTSNVKPQQDAVARYAHHFWRKFGSPMSIRFKLANNLSALDLTTLEQPEVLQTTIFM